MSNQAETADKFEYPFLPNSARVKKRLNETRSPERLLAHYTLERRLSDRLRRASREQRRTLYTEVYNELIASLPDHPLNAAIRFESVSRVDAQMRTLSKHLRPEFAFLEIGCGDAALSFALASKTFFAYAADVSDALVDFANSPANFKFVQSNGVEIPLPTGLIDLAFSNQLMEHLHPADAIDQLKEIWRVLKPGGLYICITPSRLTGPHDISCYFDHSATCFHLREYDYGMLRPLFRDAGFAKFRSCVWVRGQEISIPYPFIRAVELLLSATPTRVRSALIGPTALRRLMGVNAVGVK